MWLPSVTTRSSSRSAKSPVWEDYSLCPKGAAAVAAFKHLAAQGYLHPEQCVVLFNTGSGLKYPELVKGEFHRLNSSDPNAFEVT
jgi:threonine synthase